MTPEEFRRLGHQVVDWIADYRERAATLPVMSRVAPGEIKAQLPATPPQSAEGFEAVLRDLEHVILPGLSHWQHPRFFGYFPSNGELSSVLGDYLSTGLGVLGLSWQSSPALTEVEEVVTDWMRQMTGLSDAWSGVIQDTASSCTLVALICARERSSGFSLAGAGLQGETAPLVVYVSTHSHSSVEKAALLAGFGRANIHAIPTDGRYAMQADALREAVREDLAAGRRPCAVVATCGTTATTAFDPLEAIAAVAKEHGLWMHVDAAMAGSAMILPECRPLWAGIEGADSLVMNPHKWLGVAFDCSLYYVRDHQPELPAERRGQPGEESPRLGHPARAQVPCAQALVPDPGAGRRGPAATSATRPRQRTLAGVPRARRATLARAGSAGAADALRTPRTAGARG